MSEMIPEDVTRTASEAYDAYANGNWRDIRECIASAIMAERERAIAVVQSVQDNPPSHDPDICLDSAMRAIERGDQP